MESTPIVNFYKGKSILITGATGFLGGVVLEKLLYSCPDVKTIYVLIKSKKGVCGQERLTHLLNLTIFQRIRNENPEVLKKVILVSGDMRDDNLGLSAEDMELLRKEVSIVFHIGASVNFAQPLLEIVNANTRASEKMLRLAKSMEKIQAFVYVSTAYSNCRQNNDVIDEVIYNMTTSVQSGYYAVDNIPPTNNLLHNLIVTATMKEPIKGWVQGWNGGNTVILFQGIGLIRSWNCNVDAIIDIIPADIVANLIVAAAWDIARNNTKRQGNIKVFNCASSSQNPLTVGQLFYTSLSHSKKIHSYLIPPYPLLIHNRTLHSIIFFFLQVLPVYIIKGLCGIFGRKPRIVQLFEKIPKLEISLPFFTSNQFTFIDKNTRQLYMEMNAKDKRIFYFDVKIIDWYSYLETYVMGLKEYLLKL
ncbi:putative fatty acyl-CoA reductase CG5065 isoform X2 [Pectinophora gossypiella]|uniref:putative fatty acyl-CoA reductase CG5065 isoform X2 n=1 Tax=Pectinophora gossypiella TaxID=13191 RepID=UPI00214EBC18|nr:putative fatty acyl-CoA reductase CG5065 isoform X2 [Pectinophora gossypiella]